MTTQSVTHETPRDLTEAELALTAGGWCSGLYFMYYGPDKDVYVACYSSCSPLVTGPHCPGFR